MPRIARSLADGLPFHVLNRGNGKQRVFHTEDDYRKFLDLMKGAKEHHAVQILAYCLMPNHFHFVLVPELGAELSKWMQRLMTSYVVRYQLKYKTTGHVWQGRYKSFLIKHDQHLLTVMRYVEANPVRAGLVGSAKDWPWSSHRERVGGSGPVILDDPPIELPFSWTSFVDHPLTDLEIERIGTSIERQAPYGDAEWQQKVAGELSLESTLRSRGRPKKQKGD